MCGVQCLFIYIYISIFYVTFCFVFVLLQFSLHVEYSCWHPASWAIAADEQHSAYSVEPWIYNTSPHYDHLPLTTACSAFEIKAPF